LFFRSHQLCCWSKLEVKMEIIYFALAAFAAILDFKFLCNLEVEKEYIEIPGNTEYVEVIEHPPMLSYSFLVLFGGLVVSTLAIIFFNFKMAFLFALLTNFITILLHVYTGVKSKEWGIMWKYIALNTLALCVGISPAINIVVPS